MILSLIYVEEYLWCKLVKLIKVNEVPEKVLRIGRGRWIDETLGASKLALVFAEIEPGLPNPRYHYHEGREHMHIILKGKAKFTVEGKEYLVEENTVVLTPPGEKHRWENIGDTMLRFIEAYAPVEPDEVNLED
jgi:mannose-6-phosphate isomerase-like protein (cupin superfamily)